MPWINLARLLTLLRRRGEDPRGVTVYWDDEGYARFRRSHPRYPERSMESTVDEPEYDEEEED